MLKQTEFQIPSPRVVRIIGAFDPARPSAEQWKEWLGDKYDEEKDRVLITDHPETRAGHMFNKLYNLSASNLDKIIPTWTYGKWSNYNLTIVDDVYNDDEEDAWKRDHIRPPADGPVPNTQGVYFAHPKNPNTEERESVKIYSERNDRYINSYNYPSAQTSVEYIDIDLRRFWPVGRPYSGGVTDNQVGPGGNSWVARGTNIQIEDCNDTLDALIQGLSDWQAILAGADPSSASVWAAGFTSRNPNTSFNGTYGAGVGHAHPHAKTFYSNSICAGNNDCVIGTFNYWAWEYYLNNWQWFPLMTPAPNKGEPDLEWDPNGICARYSYSSSSCALGCFQANDACPPPMFEWEPEAYLWTTGGPDLKIYEWDWTEKIIGTDDGFGTLYGEFKDRWRYAADSNGFSTHLSNTAWCEPAGSPGAEEYCNGTVADFYCGIWYQLYRWDPCDWTWDPSLCSYGVSVDLTEDFYPYNYLPGTPSSLHGVTNRGYTQRGGNVNPGGCHLETLDYWTCWKPDGAGGSEGYDSLYPEGLNDEVFKAGEKYYVGGYWTANYGWPLHLVNSVVWDDFPFFTPGGGGFLGPIAGGLMNYSHMEGDAERCAYMYTNDPNGYVCKDIHEFPPIIEHPNWVEGLKNSAPYSRYLDWEVETEKLNEYRQAEMSQILICETLDENKRIFPVLKPIELAVYDNSNERVCPEYLEGDLIYVQWDPNAGSILEILTALGFNHTHNGEDGMFVDLNVDKRKLFDYSNVEGIKIYKDVFPEPYIPMETTFLIPSGTPLNSNAGHGDAYSFNCYPPSLMHMNRQDTVVVCSDCTTEQRSYEVASSSLRGGDGDKGDSVGDASKGPKGSLGEDGADGSKGNKGSKGPKGPKGDNEKGETGADGQKGRKGISAGSYKWEFTSQDPTIGAAAASTRLDGSTVTLGNNQIAKGNIKGRLGTAANLTAGESSETDSLYSIVFEPKKVGICAEDGVAPNENHSKYLYYTTFVSKEIIDYTE